MKSGKGKPSLAVLIGMKGPSHGSSSDDSEADMGDEHMDDEDKEYEDAGNELKDAFKQGDGKAIADAVCALVDLHMAKSQGADEGDDAEKDDKGY